VRWPLWCGYSKNLVGVRCLIRGIRSRAGKAVTIYKARSREIPPARSDPTKTRIDSLSVPRDTRERRASVILPQWIRAKQKGWLLMKHGARLGSGVGRRFLLW